jgi:hypothetical protein
MNELTDDVIQSASSIFEAMEKDLQELQNSKGDDVKIGPYYDYEVKASLLYEALEEALSRPEEWVFDGSKRRIKHKKTDTVIRILMGGRANVVEPDHIDLSRSQQRKLKGLVEACREVMFTIRKSDLYEKLAEANESK